LAQGNYDHPSYLTRQQIVAPKVAAGANTTSTLLPAPPVSNMRVRAISLSAVTTASLSSTYKFYNGTSSVGQIIVSTATAGQVLVTTDLNTTIVAGVGGTALAVVSGGDTASSWLAVVEAYLDPQATWTGVNN
jgi:hypothetical protein